MKHFRLTTAEVGSFQSRKKTEPLNNLIHSKIKNSRIVPIRNLKNLSNLSNLNVEKKYRLFIFLKSSFSPNKHIFVRAKNS